MPLSPPLNPDRFHAVLFDLDGVLTATARLHAAAWKQMFDDFLKHHAQHTGRPFAPFDLHTDYHKHVDGKPRFDGVLNFLESRGIHLPHGSPDDSPSAGTMHGLGNRKNELVNEIMARQGIEVFPGSIQFVEQARQAGLRTAVVSSSRNCLAVLQAARIEHLFDVRVDGQTAAERGLPGKPEPDTFLDAARQLGIPPHQSVVVEDAIAGVQAGSQGGFGLVIGVARRGNAEALKQAGADVVVADLAELLD